jgi:methionyl-tRNA formyltransferase
MTTDSPLRVVFMGTPRIAVPTLEALVVDGQDVVGVVTQPDRPAGRGHGLLAPPVKLAALRYGIPVLQPERLRRAEAVESLRALNPDVIVVMAYGQILRPTVLQLPRFGCVNVHPSLLPQYRGVAPINWAILEGQSETGVSIMLMDEGVDSGPVLAQARARILPDDDAETLGDRLADLGADLLVRTLREWAAGRVTPVPQDSSRATFTRMLRREDGLVDWNRPAVEIERRLRAFQPWPGLHTTWSGRTLKLLRVRVGPVASGGGPGVVRGLVDSDGVDSGLVVGTGSGTLVVHRLQLEGKRAMTAGEFARGNAGIVGVTLGGSPVQ